jgi:two-component system, cell cycle sensor histidine kinase and response regulator CckA
MVMMMMDAGGAIRWTNAAFSRLTGYDAAEVAGLTAGILDSEEPAVPLQDVVRHVAASGTPQQGCAVWRNKRGDRFEVRYTCSPIRDTAGTTPDFLWTLLEVAEIRGEETRVPAGDEQYRRIFNCCPDAVFVCKLGADGVSRRFLEVNDNACQLLGYTREELLQLQVSDIDGPEADLHLPVARQRHLAEGQTVREGTHQAKNGRLIPVEINSQILDCDGSPVVVSSVREISERKQGERQYGDIFEGAIEGIYRTSMDGRVIAANRTMARMLGYESVSEALADITSTAQQVWLDPNDRLQFLQMVAKHEIVRGLECQFKRKDGTPFWVSVNGHTVRGMDGQTQCYEGFIEDITERRRAQEALRKSEEHFRSLFENMQEGVAACRMLFENGEPCDFVYLSVNEAFERLTGLKDVAGKRVSDVIPGIRESNVEMFAVFGRVAVTAKPERFELYVEPLRTWFFISAYSPQPGQFVAVFDNITERKRAEEAHVESERRFRETLENVQLVSAILDRSGHITFCNDFLLRLTGWTRDEVIGRDWCELLVPAGQYESAVFSKQVAEKTIPSYYSNEIVTKSGERRKLSWNNTILFDAAHNPAGVATIGEDITERVRLENELRQAQKLESIGRLAGGVAHDFNNLLTVINGFSSIALEALGQNDPLRMHLREINQAGERAAALTKQLLAFSRKQLIQPRALDLNRTITEFAPILQRLIGEDIALETNLHQSTGQILADPDQIHQVIMNLALNARDAMPDGGRLEFQTMNVEFSEDNASAHPDALPGTFVLLTVTDGGQGISETTRQHIFEPFFTTKEVGKGTGLGLSTVYGIVRQSGGWIDVSSEVGVGTTFRVCLPRFDSISSPRKNEVSAVAGGGGETILVVEDQEAVRLYTKAALRHYGYHVLEASGGAEAVVVAQQHSGPIQLLLTDVVLPGMNGKELSQRLTTLIPHLRVLFMSGYTADVIAQRGIIDGGVAFLHKPFRPDELAAKVRDVLAIPPC